MINGHGHWLQYQRDNRRKWELQRPGEIKPDLWKQHHWAPVLGCHADCTPSLPHDQKKQEIWICIPNPSNLKAELHFSKKPCVSKTDDFCMAGLAPGHLTLLVASIWHSMFLPITKTGRFCSKESRGVCEEYPCELFVM